MVLSCRNARGPWIAWILRMLKYHRNLRSRAREFTVFLGKTDMPGGQESLESVSSFGPKSILLSAEQLHFHVLPASCGIQLAQPPHQHACAKGKGRCRTAGHSFMSRSHNFAGICVLSSNTMRLASNSIDILIEDMFNCRRRIQSPTIVLQKALRLLNPRLDMSRTPIPVPLAG